MKIFKKEDEITLKIVMWTLGILLFIFYIFIQIHISEGDSNFLKKSFTGIYLTISGLFIFNLNKILKKI